MNRDNIIIFFLTPSHLLKVTKVLVKISQFKFLVMTGKNEPASRPPLVFLNNRNATVKLLSSINATHVKQRHNVGFFTFKFTLKYMLGNVYITLYCLYVNSSAFNFCVVSQSILHV